MSSRSWVASSLVSRPDIFCWVFSGRTPRSLMFVGGPDLGVVAEPEHVVLPVAAELQQVTAGVLGGGVPRPGDAGLSGLPRIPGPAGQPGQDGVAELAGQRAADVFGDLGLAGVAGVVPGPDQPAQRPLCLGWPDRVRPALGRVLVVAQDVGQARLMAGQVLPPVV